MIISLNEAARMARVASKPYLPLAWFTPSNSRSLRSAVIDALNSNSDEIGILPKYMKRASAGQIQAIADGMLEASRKIGNRHFAGSDILVQSQKIRELAWVTGPDAHEKFVEWSISTYGAPAQHSLERATEILDATQRAPLPADALHITAEKFATITRNALNQFGLYHWKVLLKDISPLAAVSGPAATMKIRDDALLSIGQARRLLIHEVGRHVLSYENALLQPDPFAPMKLSLDSTRTEEGIAVWMESHLEPGIQPGQVPSSDLTKFAARTLGVHWSLTMGIMDVARALTKFMNPADSAALAVRLKRGLADMNLPGAFTKDIAYLDGYFQVKTHLDEHPGDFSLLQATKWPIERIDTIRESMRQGRLVPPQFEVQTLLDFVNTESELHANKQNS